MTSDSTTLRRFAEKSCSFCSRYADLVDDQIRLGVHLRQVSSAVKAAHLRPSRDGNVVVEVLMEDAETDFVDKNGAVTETHPHQHIGLELRLRRKGGEWRIVEADGS